MKKLKQTIILSILIIAIILLTNNYVLASNEIDINKFIKKVELSDDYKQWAELSQGQVTAVQPRFYNDLDTEYISTNPLYEINLVGAGVRSKYDLRDTIRSNVAIRNQQDTQLCWAFAGLSSLETNLALSNFSKGVNTDKVYDFSERHANYAATRTFLNGNINEHGFNRTPNTGGQWLFVENYLTNGMGAVDESAMPFENNESVIDISKIKNKTVQTRVYDTIYFDNYNDLVGDARTAEMDKIKEHIQNNGSVFAAIHGNSSDVDAFSCYNNNTAAKYCNSNVSHIIDHAVSIIGWDDNYNKDNFAQASRPTSNGAWIIRNSWGEKLEEDLATFKQMIFDASPDECISRGWNSAAEIPNEIIEGAGYEISGSKVYLPIGDNGYMYISYEDCNVGETLYGITRASDNVDYSYLYQYNEVCAGIEINARSKSIFLCNVFDKKSDGLEYLNAVSLTAPETYTCKVYVNPNGTSKRKSDMQAVALKEGVSVTIDKGYHTLEFAHPIELTGTQFAVVVEITGTRSSLNILLEGKADGVDLLDYVKTEKNKCFISDTNNFDTCSWTDLGKLEEQSSTLTNGDSSIKAFTTTRIEEKVVERIEIENPPYKTVYNEGDNFDRSGMRVIVFYTDGSSEILGDSDYSITDGNNLRYGQQFVSITYSDKSVAQPITVIKKNSGLEEEPGEDDPGKEEPGKDDPGEEPGGEQDDPSNPTAKVVNTDFSNAKCKILDIKSYYYSEDSSKDYSIIKTEINNISRYLNNDTYKYYYYISSNADLSSISNWVEIKEKQTSSNKLTFTIDTKDVVYYNEKAQASKLYIYIREVVTKGSNQGVSMSDAIRFQKEDSTKSEAYVDGVKKPDTNGGGNQQKPSNNGNDSGGSGNGNSGNGSGNGGSGSASGGTPGTTQKPSSSTSTDTTLSPINLPHTGAGFVKLLIIIISIVGIVSFVRYEIINRDTK